MGLTSWAGGKPRSGDVGVAKNYLAEDELDALNRIVTAYLEFAEVQALNRRPMHMADWIAKLDDFLKLAGRELLAHAGKVSHEVALTRAEAEFGRFAAAQAELPSRVERDFEAAAKVVEKIGKGRGKTRGA